MKKPFKYLLFLAVVLTAIVVGVVYYDTHNKNTLEGRQPMEYNMSDGDSYDKINQIAEDAGCNPENISIENMGYLIINESGITGYIDAEGNTHEWEE